MYEGISVIAPTEPVSKLLLYQCMCCSEVGIEKDIKILVQSLRVFCKKKAEFS